MTVVRLGWLWPLAAGLVLLAVFVPLGQKEVTDDVCSGNWRDGRVCEHDRWQVEYRLLSMHTVNHHWSDTEGGDPRTPREQPVYERPVDWAFAYMDDKAPHRDGITPFFWGGAAAVVVALPAGGAATWHSTRPSPASRWVLLVSWALLAASLGSFLLAMMLHSGTWEAEDVLWWRPGWGLLALGSLACGAPLLPAKKRFAMPPLPVPS